MSDHIENILRLLSSKEYKPITESDMKKKLGINKHQRKAFYKDLKKLRRQKKIVKIAKDRYILAPKNISSNMLRGVLKRKDGSFFIQDKKGEYRLPRLINPFHAVVNDEVVVRIEKRKSGIIARVVKVTLRSYKSIIGYIKKYPQGWIVEPVDRKINFLIDIKDADTLNLEDGNVVQCELARYPTTGSRAVGRILKVYGDVYDSNIDRDVVIDKYNLPSVFNESIKKELAKIKEPSIKVFKDREDFRNLYTITIDGADAKDFDDAIDIEEIQDGFRLYVHIADVSNYVKENTELDKEAFKRGFSVYFPGSVIPMLPHELSDNICSLVPDRERLSVSAVIDIDLNGKTKKYRFVKSIIRNKNRMTYRGVQDILDGSADCDKELKERLYKMQKLAKLLRKRRFTQGSIDLNVPEPEFIMEDDKIVDIEERPRWFSHFLIEEFMLAANLACADFLNKHYDVFIRRVHDEPDIKKIHLLTMFLKRLGIKYNFNKDNILSKDIQKLIESIKDESKNKIVSYLVLRSLKRAEYSIENKRHFALGFDNYTHFTSPIRRYSDLVTHRMVKAVLEGNQHEFEDLEFLVSGIQNRELITEEAEFYMDDVKSAAFMSNYLGKEFEGSIVSIIPSGMFVRLTDYFVEGFVAAEKMKDDYYEYKEELFAMIGKRKKKIYRIGYSLKVIPVSVNKFAGEVDFIIA
jgi:ribonuclease R